MHMHAAGVGAIKQYISRFGVFFDPARVLFCVRVTQARYAANMRGAAQRSAAQRNAPRWPARQAARCGTLSRARAALHFVCATTTERARCGAVIFWTLHLDAPSCILMLLVAS